VPPLSKQESQKKDQVMTEIRNMLKTMRRLDLQITEFIDTNDYSFVDPLSEFQENLQEIMEIIKSDMKSIRMEEAEGEDEE
jgi:hypothetical protein